MNTQWERYRQLELIPEDVPQPTFRSPIATWFHHIWQWLLEASTYSSEPQVWQEYDHHSNTTWWCVYDPITARKRYMDSEQEVLAWLDRHSG